MGERVAANAMDRLLGDFGAARIIFTHFGVALKELRLGGKHISARAGAMDSRSEMQSRWRCLRPAANVAQVVAAVATLILTARTFMCSNPLARSSLKFVLAFSKLRVPRQRRAQTDACCGISLPGLVLLSPSMLPVQRLTQRSCYRLPNHGLGGDATRESCQIYATRKRGNVIDVPGKMRALYRGGEAAIALVGGSGGGGAYRSPVVDRAWDGR